MATRRSTRQTRLDFRIKTEHKSLIERAASVKGQTVTDFAVAALVKAANESIDQATSTRLSQADSRIFLQMLNSQAAPNAALRSAAKRYKSRG